MLLSNDHFIHIHTIFKPPLLIRNFHIIPIHLPLPHASIRREGPVFQPISTPPLPGGIVPFVPKLNCDLESRVSVVYLIFPDEIFHYLEAAIQNSFIEQADAQENQIPK